MPERLFRCAGDVHFNDTALTPGVFVDVELKAFSETCNYLQCQSPLSRQHPCFFARINSMTNNSVVSVGIAGSNMSDDVHSGQWNGSVGYHSNGHCYSSHKDGGSTAGEHFSTGDIIGVIVTHFGKNMSTVVFSKNGKPIATRYLFESDHGQYLPTIALENGPINMGVMWPEAVEDIPRFCQANLEDWIKDSTITYTAKENQLVSTNRAKLEVIAQSPVPFSKDCHHYEMVVHEVDATGAAATIGMAACSPLHPPPTCPLFNNNFHWHPDGAAIKMKVGETMSWGIWYDPSVRDSHDFDDKGEQLVLCYVTMNQQLVYTQIVLQPTGGWFPSVSLHPYASRVQLNMNISYNSLSSTNLDSLYRKLLPDALGTLNKDRIMREISVTKLRLAEGLTVDSDDTYTTISLSKNKKGIYVVQFNRPLTAEQNYYQVEVVNIGDSSLVCAGIAGSDFPLDRFPGKMQDTVGYFSRDGRMCYNSKDKGNMAGRRFGRGDVVGVELEVFEVNMSVVLFSKNSRPVGTRYLTQKNHAQFLPTVALCANGSDVNVKVVWQNRVAEPPVFSVTDIGHWCLPEGAEVDQSADIIHVEPSHTEAETIQAPYSLHREYNHFEVELIDDFSEAVPPPAIALCTASPFDPAPKSNFKQDFIRFWAMGEAQKAVQPGDLIGWGMIYPEEYTHHDAEQLVICYLTINRNVALTRVMYQPPGGFYPVILLPPGVDRVKLNFGATIITEHPFTEAAIVELLTAAEAMIILEERQLRAGGEPEDWDSEQNKAKYLKPLPSKTAAESHRRSSPTARGRANKRTPRIANLLEEMLKGNCNNGGVEQKADTMPRTQPKSNICTIL